MENNDIIALSFGVRSKPSIRPNASKSSGRSRLPLKRVHSLEIPGLENDKDFFLIDPSEGLSEDQNDWLPEFVLKGDGELDELIAASLRPSTSKPLSIATLDNISTASRSRGHKRRISRKEQIQDLRNTVEKLSQRLRGLRMPSLSSISPTAQQEPSILTSSQSLWENMAIHQLQLRREAEEENVKLKKMLASQRRSARNIRRLLQRRVDEELLAELRNVKQPSLDNNEEVFRNLLHEIEEIYASMDDLYNEADMKLVRRIIPDAPTGFAFVELNDKNIVPFEIKRVGRAVWKFLQGPRVLGGRRVYLEESQQSHDTSMSCIGFTCPEKAVATYVLEQRVSRRYVEDNRIVFVNRTITTPTIDDPWFSSLRFSETLSIVVTIGSPLTSGQETTIIESHLSVCRYVGTEPAVERHWPKYVDEAASRWERKTEFNRQEIENLLFETI
ncbi:hypothetical protein DVH05_003973 [Phytophthora capsici]|nr:hypothetical protein DVH05_003973 [Phytophthora capsici]